MTVMRDNELRHALNASIDLCQPSDRWKNHLVRQIVAGEKAEKKLKLSVGLVVAIVLVLLSIVALAVSMLTRNYYDKVADMDAAGALARWNMKDKITFVRAMKEENFEIDPEDYAVMTDDTLPDQQREAAADRIVDHTYGELIRAQLGYYIVEDWDSLGIAPDPVIIFEERYLAEHPEGIETHEQVRDYMDALGYWLRDEYEPSFETARENLGEKWKDTESVFIDFRQSTALAEQAVQEKYRLSREEVRKYFTLSTFLGMDTDLQPLVRIDFVTHYAMDQERIYGVVVSPDTGIVETVFDYLYDEPQWRMIGFAAGKELTEGLYISWPLKSKQQLTGMIRDCNLLPDHAYWSLGVPSEAETDALVAEASAVPAMPPPSTQWQ